MKSIVKKNLYQAIQTFKIKLLIVSMFIGFSSCDTVKKVITEAEKRDIPVIKPPTKRETPNYPADKSETEETGFNTNELLWGRNAAVPQHHTSKHLMFHKARYDRMPVIYEDDGQVIDKELLGENRCDIYERANDVSIIELLHHYKNQLEQKNYSVLLYAQDNGYGISRKVMNAYDHVNKNRSWISGRDINNRSFGGLALDFTFFWSANYILAKGRQNGRDHIFVLGVSTQHNLYFIDQLYNGTSQQSYDLPF